MRRVMTAIGCVAVLMAAAGMGWHVGRMSRGTEAESDTVKVTVVDTVMIHGPAAKDSTEVRYVTRWMERVDENVGEDGDATWSQRTWEGTNGKMTETKGQRPSAQNREEGEEDGGDEMGDEGVEDGGDERGDERGDGMVMVKVPITQKVYEDSGYVAWVSGFEQKIDSIRLYERCVTETVTCVEKKKKTGIMGRIGIGITTGAGYGMIHRKADVWVGVGVCVRMWP